LFTQEIAPHPIQKKSSPHSHTLFFFDFCCIEIVIHTQNRRCKALGKMCVDVDGREYDPHHDEHLERERQQRLTGTASSTSSAPPSLTIQPPNASGFSIDGISSSTSHHSAGTFASNGIPSASTHSMTSPISSTVQQQNNQYSTLMQSSHAPQHHSNGHHSQPSDSSANMPIPAMDPDTISSTSTLLNHMQQIRSHIRTNNDKIKPPPNYFVKSFYCDIPVSMMCTTNPGTPTKPFLMSCNPAFCRLMQCDVDNLHMKSLHQYMPFTVNESAPQHLFNMMLKISQFIGNKVVYGNREVSIKNVLYREDFSVHADNDRTTWHCMHSPINQWTGDCSLFTQDGQVLSTSSGKFSMQHNDGRNNLLLHTLEDLVRQIEQYSGHY